MVNRLVLGQYDEGIVDIDEVARKVRLENAGYNYQAVQDRVNELLGEWLYRAYYRNCLW